MSEFDHTSEVQGLFVKHYGSVHAYIRSLVRDPIVADDLVQTVFFVVTSKAETFTLGTNFIAWVFTISRFEVLRYFQKQKRAPINLSEDVLQSLVVDAPADLADTPLQQALVACMKKLSPRLKDLIHHRYEEGMKPKAIAEKIGWTAESVSVSLSRARLSLRGCIERKLRHEA